MSDITPEEAAQNAVHAAKNAQQAVELARAAQTKQMTESLTEALRDVFGEGETSGRFVDITRIPLICKSILDMHANLTEIKEMLDQKFVSKERFAPIEKVVYGLVGLMLTAVVVAILGTIILH